jgi:hypothetical protein
MNKKKWEKFMLGIEIFDLLRLKPAGVGARATPIARKGKCCWDALSSLVKKFTLAPLRILFFPTDTSLACKKPHYDQAPFPRFWATAQSRVDNIP